MLSCMAPDKDRDKNRKPAGQAFERAYHARESGRAPQRKPPQKRRDDVSDAGITASHGEEPSVETNAPLPREDRAG
jgi:hypothetical protein